MMYDDLKVWVVIERLGEHEARHGGGGLVGPAEGPPDLVKRLLLVAIIRHLGAARRMHPDRLTELVHLLPERLVFGPVERLAADIGVDLHAERAELLDGAFRLAHAGVRRAE